MSLTLSQALAERPFTLALSSGFFGFFAHAGVLSALEAEGLHPRGFVGSSAGALVGAAAASGLSADALHAVLAELRRADFWDARPGWGLLRGERFRTLLESTLGAARFEECPRPVAVSAWSISAKKTRVLRAGDLPSAVHASCCFPGLFQPVLREGERLLDGGIGDRAGLAGLPPGETVLHHHLASKSPWRRAKSDALKPPQRPGLSALVIDGLPRISPFRLEQGPLAFAAAREATRRALDLPMAAILRLSA